MGDNPQGPTMNTMFELCNDVARTRTFYSELLGLNETFYDAEQGWLTYQAGGVQIVFTRPASPMTPLTEFSRSPAWDGGSIEAPSWVLRVEPHEFEGIVERLLNARVKFETRIFEERGLHEVYALDPMGRTVEVYCEEGTDDGGEAPRERLQD